MTAVTPGRGAFRAILWKEWREALPWGAVAGAIVTAALVYLVHAFGDGSEYEYRHVPTIMDMYPATMWGGPFVGLLIGLAQMIPEHRGDRWGFLTHRPVGRTMLFVGKASVGMLLYLAAYGLPLAGAIWWTAAPGHLAAPFEVHMIQPAIADVACGLVYYFAALLMSMRDARWYGSRAIGVVLAIGCTAEVMSASWLWLALLVCAVGIVVSSLAAWGTFIGGGWYAPQPRVGRAAIVLMVALVVCPIYGVGVDLAVDRVANIFHHVSPVRSAPKPQDEYSITTDGMLVQWTRDSSNGRVTSVNDPEGRPIPRYADTASWRRVESPSGIVSTTLTLQYDPDDGSGAGYRSWSSIYRAFDTRETPGASCYYLYRQRAIVGYNVKTTRLIGWFGPAGFTAGAAIPQERFPGPIQGVSHERAGTSGPVGIWFDFTSTPGGLIPFSHVVYRLDFAKRKVDSVFVAAAGDSVMSAESIAAKAGDDRLDAQLGAIATSKNFYLLTGRGTPIVVLPLDSTTRARYGEVEVLRALQAPDIHTFLRYHAENGPMPYAEWGRVPDRVTEVGNDGAVIGQLTLPPAAAQPNPAAIVAAGEDSTRIQWEPLVAGALSAGPAYVAGEVTLGFLMSRIVPAQVTFAMSMDRRVAMSCASIVALALLCAGVALWVGRRYAFSPRQRWVWAAIVFGLGVSGLLVMFIVLEWPSQEPALTPSSPRAPARPATEWRTPETAVARGTGAFRAVFWKELRESAKWGGAAFVIVAVTTAMGLRIFASETAWWVRSNSVLTRYSAITFAVALVALMIGVAQTIPESRGDRWSFLAHRPMSRTMLFWGKALAGLFWYLLATAVPVGYGIMWAAQPGHIISPFDPRMALPAVADIAAGVVYYFAALMIGMRDARWYATRGLAIGVALMCSEQVMQRSAFWEALLVCALGTVVVGTGAWGTFVSGGEDQPRPWWARVGVGLSVGAGMAIVIGVLVAGVSMLSMKRSHAAPPPVAAYERGQNVATSYAVTTDGAIAQIVSDGPFGITAVNDLAGHPVNRFADSASRNNDTVSAGVATAMIALEPENEVGKGEEEVLVADGALQEGYRADPTFFRPLEACSMSGPDVSCRQESGYRRLLWYYVRRERLVAAYDTDTGRLIGWLGPAGFTAGDSPPADRFPDAGTSSWEGRPRNSLISFSGGVYRLNLSRRTVDRVFVPDAGDSVITPAWETALPHPSMGLIATKTELVVLSPNTAPLVVHPDTTAHYDNATVSRAFLAKGSPTFVRFSGPRDTMDLMAEFGSNGAMIGHVKLPRASLDEMIWVAWNGTVVRHALPMSPAARAALASSHEHFSPLGALGWLLHPPVLDLPTLLSVETIGRERLIRGGEVVLLAFFWGAIGYAIGRRRAVPVSRVWLWTAIATALGPSGLLIMRAVVDWPVRESCPSCGRPRVVTRDRCEHCGAPFAAPTSNGTELFDASPGQGTILLT